MSFILGNMSHHLNGRKELTAHEETIILDAPSLVKIPLVSGRSECELLVKEMDRVKVGTKIGEITKPFYIPIYSSVSGIVKGIEKVSYQTSSVNHLVIENDFKYESGSILKGLDYEKASKDEIVEYTKESGIVGCGGAGFPTFVKYMPNDGIDTLIINAVECEPYITSDYRNISDEMDLFVYGVKAMFKMSNAKNAYIGIKKTKKDLINAVKEAFKNEKNINVSEVRDVYPMGWERTLIYEITKKRYNRLPSEVGCIVSNATTAIAFADSMINKMPITKKIITVSGDGISKPRNVKAYIGTPIKELIEACGGYNGDDIILVNGGPMMGKSMSNDDFVVTASTNAITVLKNKKIEAIACLRCGRCSDYCPAGLQPVRINNAHAGDNLDIVLKLNVNDCIECGLCSYVCPSKIDVTEGIRSAKKYVALNVGK